MRHTATTPHRVLATLAATTLVAVAASVWFAPSATAGGSGIDQFAPAPVDPDWPQPEPEPDPEPTVNPAVGDGSDDLVGCVNDSEGNSSCDDPTDEPTPDPSDEPDPTDEPTPDPSDEPEPADCDDAPAAIDPGGQLLIPSAGGPGVLVSATADECDAPRPGTPSFTG